MSPLGRPPVFLDIIEEHFDELDVLWEHREANIHAAEWTLRDLAAHEERAEANLDGLRLSELHGVDLARGKLSSGFSAAMAAAFVLWESGDADARAAVLEQLREGAPPIRDAIRRVLRHVPGAELRQELLGLIGGDPAVAAAAADVLAFHRSSLPPFDHLIGEADAAIATNALRAAGRARRFHVDDFTRVGAHEAPAVRLAAFEAAARAGLTDLPNAVRAAALDGDAVAVGFLGTLGQPSDVAMLERAIRDAELAPVAVGALGAMGRVQSVPLLLDLMSDSALAIHATAAYKRITGATSVEGQKPLDRPPVADGEDEEEALPPDPVKAKQDWERRQSAFTPERSWQAGIGIEDGLLPAEFNALSLAARRDVYLRLRARNAAVPDIELEAFATRQRTV